jgi:hypothetical protein
LSEELGLEVGKRYLISWSARAAFIEADASSVVGWLLDGRTADLVRGMYVAGSTELTDMAPALVNARTFGDALALVAPRTLPSSDTSASAEEPSASLRAAPAVLTGIIGFTFALWWLFRLSLQQRT